MQYSTLRSTHIKLKTTPTKWNTFGMEMKIITMKHSKNTPLLNIIVSMTTQILLHHKQANLKPMMPYNVRHNQPDVS
jgi:hypothetical protein